MQMDMDIVHDKNIDAPISPPPINDVPSLLDLIESLTINEVPCRVPSDMNEQEWNTKIEAYEEVNDLNLMRYIRFSDNRLFIVELHTTQHDAVHPIFNSLLEQALRPHVELGSIDFLNSIAGGKTVLTKNREPDGQWTPSSKSIAGDKVKSMVPNIILEVGWSQDWTSKLYTDAPQWTIDNHLRVLDHNEDSKGKVGLRDDAKYWIEVGQVALVVLIGIETKAKSIVEIMNPAPGMPRYKMDMSFEVWEKDDTGRAVLHTSKSYFGNLEKNDDVSPIVSKDTLFVRLPRSKVFAGCPSLNNVRPVIMGDGPLIQSEILGWENTPEEIKLDTFFVQQSIIKAYHSYKLRMEK